MKEEEKRTFELFKVLGNPVRLQIIEMLGEKKFCVNEFVKSLKKPQCSISNNLKKLRDKDIVGFITVGKKVYYYLKKTELIDLIAYAKRIISR